MSRRLQVLTFLKANGPKTTAEVAASLLLTSKQASDACSQMVAKGELLRDGKAWVVNLAYAPTAKPRGAAAHKHRKGGRGAKVRGFRAEARARRKLSRAAAAGKPRSLANGVRKPAGPRVAFEPAFATETVPQDAGHARVLSLVRATGEALCAAVVEMGCERPTALTLAARAHALALSTIV